MAQFIYLFIFKWKISAWALQEVLVLYASSIKVWQIIVIKA